MNLKTEIQRSVAAPVLLAVILVGAGLLLFSETADLLSAMAERDTKGEFVAQSLRRSGSLRADPSEGAKAQRLRIVAESETLAAADLDTLVRSTVVDAGGSVVSTQTEAKHEETGPAGKVRAQAVAEGSIESIQKALFRLETGTPLVLIDEFAMQPVNETGSSRGDAQSPLLHVTMTLSAYWTLPAR